MPTNPAQADYSNELSDTTLTTRTGKRRKGKKGKRKTFTRIPKVHDLRAMGVSRGAICTYAALADYSGNRSGECNPQINTLARVLGVTRKTVWRHLVELEAHGLIQRSKKQLRKIKKGVRGQFGAWKYRLLHILEIRKDNPAKAVGHSRGTADNSPSTKGVSTTPLTPPRRRDGRRRRNRGADGAPRGAQAGPEPDKYRRWMGKDAQYHDQDLADEHGQLLLTDAYQGD